MSDQFTTTYDDCGNVSVRSGWIISKGLPDIRVGPPAGGLPTSPMTGDLAAQESPGKIYLGGSGRNLVLSGFPAATHDGVWRHGYPGKWSNGPLALTYVASGATTITDGTGTLAIRTSGGPLGRLDSTPYGEGLLGSAFAVVVAAEWSAPGVPPKADMLSSASGLQKMDFTATDAAHYTSTQDPRFTIDIQEGGDANLRFDSVIIAIRDDGPNDNPAGQYESTTAGLDFNPRTPGDDDDEDYVEPPAVNPFGILTLTYSWPAVPDLDTTTTFLGGKVGYGSAYLAPYMTHSGDDQSPSGSETVVIDLAAAWAAGAIQDTADITCMADWYPPGSYGPASLAVTYTGAGFTPISQVIQPGNFRPGAITVVASLRINADGSSTHYKEPWVATLTRRRVPPPAGVIYLQEVSVAGVFTTTAGPTFTAARPADTAQKYCIPLATSDGAGQLEAMWTGLILRR